MIRTNPWQLTHKAADQPPSAQRLTRERPVCCSHSSPVHYFRESSDETPEGPNAAYRFPGHPHARVNEYWLQSKHRSAGMQTAASQKQWKPADSNFSADLESGVPASPWHVPTGPNRHITAELFRALPAGF